MQERERQSVCQHILGASANLLGICFAVFTVVRAMGRADSTLIDELALVSVLFFMGACLFSYASMRSRKRWVLYERVADSIFIGALAFLSILGLVLAAGLIS